MRSTAGDTSSNRELREFLSANLTLLPSPSFNVLKLDITQKPTNGSSRKRGPGVGGQGPVMLHYRPNRPSSLNNQVFMAAPITARPLIPGPCLTTPGQRSHQH